MENTIKLFYDGKAYNYNPKTGIVTEGGFFFMETAPALYPFEVIGDIKGREENLIK